MKQINNYILEKLRLNKEYKPQADKDVVNLIDTTTSILFGHKDITAAIDKWVSENDVNEVAFYISKETYKVLYDDYEVEDKMLKNLTVDDDMVNAVKKDKLDKEYFTLDDNRVCIETSDKALIYTGGYSVLFTIVVYKLK